VNGKRRLTAVPTLLPYRIVYQHQLIHDMQALCHVKRRRRQPGSVKRQSINAGAGANGVPARQGWNLRDLAITLINPSR
jgi:hypothetical protein